MDFRSSTFVNNVGSKGGAVQIAQNNNQNTTITHATFTNNTSTAGSAGALHAVNAPDMFIAHTNFTDHHAALDGGTINVVSSFLTVNASRIEHSTANRSGGAIAASEGASILLYNSFMTGNTAGIEGGGVLSCVNCSAIVMKGDTFNNNTSHGAGGVLKTDADTQLVSLQSVHANGNRYFLSSTVFSSSVHLRLLPGQHAIGYILGSTLVHMFVAMIVFSVLTRYASAT